MEHVRNFYNKLGLDRFAEIGYFVLCFLLFMPTGIDSYADYVYSVYKWVLLLVIAIYIVIYFIKRFTVQYAKKLVIDNKVFLIMLVYFFLVNVVLAPERVVPETAKLFLPLFCLMLLFAQDNILESRFWKTFVYYCKTMLMINFLLIIIFPDGIYRAISSSTYERAYWLFGSRNNMAVFLILFFTVVYVDNLYNRTKTNGSLRAERSMDIFDNIYLHAFYVIYPIIMCGDDGLELFEGSSTGMLSVAALVFLIAVIEIIYKTKNKCLNKLFDPRFLFVAVILLSVIIPLGSGSTETFEWLTSALGRNSTFTGRSDIWKTVMEYIGKSPIVGYGEVDISFKINPFTGLDVTYAYSGILGVMLRYGAIGLVLYLVFLFKPFFMGQSGILQKACSCGIFAFLVVGMMNEYSDIFLSTLVFLAVAVQKQTKNEIEDIGSKDKLNRQKSE